MKYLMNAMKWIQIAKYTNYENWVNKYLNFGIFWWKFRDLNDLFLNHFIKIDIYLKKMV